MSGFKKALASFPFDCFSFLQEEQWYYNDYEYVHQSTRILTVNLRTRVDNALSMMREPRQMDAILLALELLCMLPLLAVVYL